MTRAHNADGRRGLAAQRKLNRYRKHCVLRDRLADLLEHTMYAYLAPKVRACHRLFSGWTCANGHTIAKPKASCDCRLCAFEARERSMRMQKKFEGLILRKKNAKYAVLSEASCGDLAAGIRHLFASWGRLRRLPVWADVRGALVALEITYNRRTRRWHPHLNVLIDCPDWIDRAKLGDAWRQATQDPLTLTPWIERTNRNTVRELLKYITKLNDLIGYNDPAIIEEFLDATARVRFLRTYGSFYGIGVSENDGEDLCTCPDCGAQLQLTSYRLYLNQVYLDSGGIWRPFGWATQSPKTASPAELSQTGINTGR